MGLVWEEPMRATDRMAMSGERGKGGMEPMEWCRAA